MKSLDNIAEDLFNKIRGRFPSVTIGDEAGKVTNDPLKARFFDYNYKEGDRNVGKVSISISEDKLAVMYSNSFVENEDTITRQNWYNFLKELRVFAKKRLLQFDSRDITKSNLDKRDYKFLAQQQGGEQTMSESKMYGTSKMSYQNIGNARLTIKHTESVNQELASGRTQKIGKIYIESAEGEKFIYPFKHLNGARAMARHVAEGGKPYDEFGKHITGLSEELANLRKFKTYMNRSSVMAEGLSGYMDAVVERLDTIKKTVASLQKESYYKAAVESYEVPVMEDVPADIAENWIDELTIRQFNEELKDVFPYVYKLVSEATRAIELGPDDLSEELPAETYKVQKGDTIFSIYKRFKNANFQGSAPEEAIQAIMDENPDIKDPSMIQPGQIIKMPYFMGAGPDGASRGLPPGGFKNYGEEIESEIDTLLGQFSDRTVAEDDDPCWKGYKQIGMKEKNGKEVPNCVPENEEARPKEKQIPISEFILSLFDRENGQFPKGETAVLTAVEKDYGEQYINPAKAFIERIQETYADFKEVNVAPVASQEENDIKRLAGL